MDDLSRWCKYPRMNIVGNVMPHGQATGLVARKMNTQVNSGVCILFLNVCYAGVMAGSVGSNVAHGIQRVPIKLVR